MSQEVDVRNVDVVYSAPNWRIFTKNLAIATGVTGDGRTVQGIGTSRWSGDSAMDEAVEDLKQRVRTTDFSFRITAVEGGHANVRIDFLEEQGLYRTTGSTRGLTATKRVEVSAEKAGRSVSAESDEGGLSMDHVGFGSNDWADILDGAIDDARSSLDRVGTTTV
jgi:flavin-binding protein dodecin